MDLERLIELVRGVEALYAMSHCKYSDNAFRENAWKEIGLKLNQPAASCKKSWINLRDSYRRVLKNKRGIFSGRAASKIKKWRYEDELSFLMPHMQERKTCINLELLKDRGDDKSDDRGNNNNKQDDRNNNECDVKFESREDYPLQNKKMRKGRNAKEKKGPTVQPTVETASTDIKYLLDKKETTKSQSIQTSSATDAFFTSMAETVKNFSPYFQNAAKSKIFQIVSDIEIQEIMRRQQQEQTLQFPCAATHNNSFPSSSSSSVMVPLEMQQSCTSSYGPVNKSQDDESSLSLSTPIPSPLQKSVSPIFIKNEQFY